MPTVSDHSSPRSRSRSAAVRPATYFNPPASAGASAGFGGGAVLDGCVMLRRPMPARARDVENHRSSRPWVDPPRFISRLVHCSDGSPRLPARRDTELLPDSHRVSTLTRSRDRYSDSRCQTVVFRSSDVSPKALAAGSLSKTVGLRGRKSVAENLGSSVIAGAVKESRGSASDRGG